MNRLHIAIVNRSSRATTADVSTMTGAVFVQLALHVAPTWDRSPPFVVFYPNENEVPAKSYKIAIVDQPDLDGALGYHTELSDGAVQGFVFTNPVLDNGGVMLYDPHNPQTVSVSSVLSHEVMEAFVDPNVNLWADGPAIAQGSSYSVEVADPVEGDSYTIQVNGNLVSVSNFVTPAFFDGASRGGKYDWLGKLNEPFTMTPGGYMVVRSTPGTEKQIFGDKMPVWKRQLKAARLGHGGRKAARY